MYSRDVNLAREYKQYNWKPIHSVQRQHQTQEPSMVVVVCVCVRGGRHSKALAPACTEHYAVAIAAAAAIYSCIVYILHIQRNIICINGTWKFCAKSKLIIGWRALKCDLNQNRYNRIGCRPRVQNFSRTNYMDLRESKISCRVLKQSKQHFGERPAGK